jgi:tetratricopeptide (TPR) repeat protein
MWQRFNVRYCFVAVAVAAFAAGLLHSSFRSRSIVERLATKSTVPPRLLAWNGSQRTGVSAEVIRPVGEWVENSKFVSSGKSQEPRASATVQQPSLPSISIPAQPVIAPPQAPVVLEIARRPEVIREPLPAVAIKKIRPIDKEPVDDTVAPELVLTTPIASAPVAIAPIYSQSVPTEQAPVLELETSTPLPVPRFAPTAPNTAEARVVNSLAQKHVAKGFSLGERNAVFAARKEFLQALRMMGQTTDAAHGLAPDDENSCVLALRRGLEAMTETADFAHCDGDADELQHIVSSHRTPLFRDSVPTTVVAAQQAYFTYALEQFTLAAAGNPMASQALTGLGKCCLLDVAQTNEMLRNSQALVYQQAAWQADRRNHLAANELGVLLGKFGQWNAAKRVMLQAVRVHGDASSWQNLATIHAQLGEADLAKLAMGESLRWRTATGMPNVYSGVDGSPAVQWVDPRAFGGPPDDAAVPPQVQTARTPSATPSRWR